MGCLPPNWNFIIKKAEGFDCGRIVQKSCWCRPLPGSVKINWTVGRDGLSCGFFGRNSKGMFCVAGVYTSHDITEIKSLIVRMLHDCTDWCRSKNVNFVYFETEDWRGKNVNSVYFGTEDWRGVIWDGNNCSDIRIHNIQCAKRVNCVAKCLVNICIGGSVMFLKKEGLPKGLGGIISLEGIPHFEFVPGRKKQSGIPNILLNADAGLRCNIERTSNDLTRELKKEKELSADLQFAEMKRVFWLICNLCRKDAILSIDDIVQWCYGVTKTHKCVLISLCCHCMLSFGGYVESSVPWRVVRVCLEGGGAIALLVGYEDSADQNTQLYTVR
nr:uncharacterized protein LOC109147873 [Ipomoea batatas]